VIGLAQSRLGLFVVDDPIGEQASMMLKSN